LELLLELGIYLDNICLCLCSFCCKGILEFSTLYFTYFAPSAHLIQSWNLFQTSNFNTAHFRIQYCTLFIQYCTQCAILHTKIGPAARQSLWGNSYRSGPVRLLWAVTIAFPKQHGLFIFMMYIIIRSYLNIWCMSSHMCTFMYDVYHHTDPLITWPSPPPPTLTPHPNDGVQFLLTSRDVDKTSQIKHEFKAGEKTK
jgi:hypothetical protein